MYCASEPCIYEAFNQINTEKKVKERDIDFEMKSTLVCMYCKCALMFQEFI